MTLPSESLDDKVARQVVASQGQHDVVVTKLQTDGRVLARVTDGIYRQPASALRELISNAYDADATRVVIDTDRPRFSRITIEDDGVGMSVKTLVHLLHHIGGSAKRSDQGESLGVTGDLPILSPGGRRLIGKTGIGLFSISQLTQRFQIITKVRGEPRRTVAVVALRQYSDTQLANSEDKYETGQVNIWQEPAPDTESHGTTIVLDGVRPKTRESLQSRGRWLQIDRGDQRAPRYHIGRFDATTKRLLAPALPWGLRDTPTQSFQKLVDQMWKEVDRGDANPKLSRVVDSYLEMAWQLSLAAPLPYIHGHPFDIDLADTLAYQLPGEVPGPARLMSLPDGKSIRSALSLPYTSNDGLQDFSVLLDDLELSRPLIFTDLPSTANVVKNTMLFVGGLREEFIGMDVELSGGPLDFQAYLMWSPKIVPVEHQGSLIRIYGASGTLFDANFMNYQVPETTRRRQITCEIFVSEGLEAALNIDRESFNYSHPHVVRLTSWLHNALARVVSQQKQLGRQLRAEMKRKDATKSEVDLAAIVEAAWAQVAGDDFDLPTVSVYASTASPGHADIKLSVADFDRDVRALPRFAPTVEAIAQVLSAYDLLDELAPAQQARLISAILRVVREVAR